MKTKFYMFAALIALVTFSGCKKEGPPGPAGEDGNANVQSSAITFSNWYWNNSAYYDCSDFTWGAITNDIANTGGVFIYLSNGAGGWVPLPRTVYPSTSYSQSQRYVYSTGAFTVIVQDSDLTQPVNPGTWTIKVLAVASSLRQANPQLDWNDYEQVKKTLKLKD
jgi:hypothetical protein